MIKSKWKTWAFRLWQWTWGFPQTFAGFLYSRWIRRRGAVRTEHQRVYAYYYPNEVGYVSLGAYCTYRTPDILQHEYGHSLQSAILGPLYLLVIGIPSILWAGLGQGYRNRTGANYYSFYTERWADKLGKVER